LPAIGGAELHVHHLARALQALGHEVTVITGTPGPPCDGAMEVVRLPLLAHQGRGSGVALALCDRKIRKLVREADIVHGHQTAMVSADVARAATALGKPFVVTLHGFGTLPSSVGNDRYRLRWREWCFANADAVIATTPEMREIAETFVPGAAIVDIANGVDTELFSRAADIPTPDHLMTVRRLVPKNGVQYVVEAMKDILRKRPQTRLTIVGDGAMRSQIETRVRELGISDAVSFMGEVAHERLPSVIATASHVVFASSAEGFSLAALEAMSVGRPVIASAVGGFPQMIGENDRGFLVRIFERSGSDYGAPAQLDTAGHDALVSGVLSALEDREASARVAAAAAQWVRVHYDWAAIADRVSAVYGRVAQGRPLG
jgi:glycosyltransferase involved in cell wall biosynthesis